MQTYRFEAVAETALSAAQEQAIVHLIAPIYTRVDFGGRSFFQQRHSLRLLAWEEDLLVAHMALTYRVVRLGEELWDVMGIAEVVTHSKHRRQGLASQLLAMAEEKAMSRAADALLLFGTEGLYARAGFKRAHNVITYVDMAGCRTGQTVETSTHALMVKPLADKAWDDDGEVDLLGAIF